ncbi:MAG TPA: CPBP family intramembrane metalloprotease, partial [Bacillota bacterium]|nr:CPBP family intramembrane metalloprotease [Bacillota bacterium]
FQLFLSGPAEELLYRALPISLLLYASGSKAKPGSTVTPEIIIASILFALAHIKWSLSPFTVSLDYMQLLYAMGMGVIQGVAYQKSRSVLYPILIHSLSNLIMVGMGYLFILLA